MLASACPKDKTADDYAPYVRFEIAIEPRGLRRVVRLGVDRHEVHAAPVVRVPLLAAVTRQVEHVAERRGRLRAVVVVDSPQARQAVEGSLDRLVEDADGGRFWLFRSGLYPTDEPPKWWLHGLFP